MENYGSEIGQKMRSAVKAKLLELGTGGSSAYIDDELPDYVMIMVANKRSKQQMTTDLNLFLGSQTELFVTWLHEVLQKLQEVTLPAANASSKKRKSHTSTSDATSKKDKKSAKKDKKGYKKSLDEAESPELEKPTTTTDAVVAPAINSITDVFAEDLLEKAKKTLDVTSSLKDEIKKKKSRRLSVDRRPESESQKDRLKDNQEFDIPTIGEITSTTGGNGSGSSKELTSTVGISGNREKDLAELAEIQKKISAAKKHLRKIGEIDDGDESEEDDDFLNLKDDEPVTADYELVESVDKSTQSNLPKKPKSPIVFNKHTETTEVHLQAITAVVHGPAPPQPNREKEIDRDREREREREKRQASEERSEQRRSVHERLGIKPIQTTERRPRQQKEIYVPAHRRKENENERDHNRERERERERDRERPRQREHPDRSRERVLSRDRNRRERQIDITRKRRLSPEEQRQHRSASSDQPKQRVVSHVIVAPNKPIESSDNEDIDEKPVNSIIKVKPRPPVSPSRQACKNLLLRAVADAQRSTILVKSDKKLEPDASLSASRRSTGDRGVKLYSKSYRDRERLNRNEPSAELFRRTTRSLVVEVKNGKGASRKRESPERCIEDTEEYVPKMIIDEEDSPTEMDVYVPQVIGQSLDTLEVAKDDQVKQFEQNRQNTQFVVTLHGDKVLEKYRKRTSTSHKRSVSPLPQVSSSSNVGLNSTEPSSTTGGNDRGRRRKSDPKPRLSARGRADRTPSNSPSSSKTPPPMIGYNQKRTEAGRQLIKEVKKIIIKNDTDEDEEAYSKKPSSVPSKRQALKRHSDGGASNGFGKGTDVTRAQKIKKQDNSAEERSTTPPMPPVKQSSRSCSEKRVTSASGGSGNSTTADISIAAKVKHTPIKFTLKSDERERLKSPKRQRSRSLDREERSRCSSTERRKISIRTAEDRKYDNIPSLSSVTVVDSTVLKVVKPKERCKYHPNCTKQFCDYYHPTAPCKSFPNCKFADKCLYSHPKCKYDLACMSIDCNFAHSGPRDLNHAQLSAPPLSSHVIPVQNYKSISAASVATSTTGTMCKYYPNCTKAGCTFYHPKPCRYGKNCINKLECAYYHPEMQSSNKFKWVASIV